MLTTLCSDHGLFTLSVSSAICKHGGRSRHFLSSVPRVHPSLLARLKTGIPVQVWVAAWIGTVSWGQFRAALRATKQALGVDAWERKDDGCGIACVIEKFKTA